MNVIKLRKKLADVDGKTWAKIGVFFSSYVSDEELNRWISYQRKLNIVQENDSEDQLQFSYMLMYFLENVFLNAERYSRIPDVLKKFCESNDDEMIELGIKLQLALQAHENLKDIQRKIPELSQKINSSCYRCGCFELINKIENIMLR